MTHEPSYWPDIAQELDTIGDKLREALGELALQPMLTRKIAEWHLQRVDAEAHAIASEIAAEAITRLAEIKGPLQTQALGALFASGLHGRIGFNSITQAARAAGVTKQAISKHSTAARRKLSLPNNMHSKSAEACATYAELNKRNHWRKALKEGPPLIEGNDIKYMFMAITNLPSEHNTVRRVLRNKQPMRVIVNKQTYNCIERDNGIELVEVGA
jgi:hypothetical protein